MNLGVIGAQSLIRRALCSLLSSIKHYRVVLSVDDALGNLELIQRSHPDVLLIDSFPPSDDFSVVSRLAEVFPDVKLLLLCDRSDEDYQMRALRCGAWGCVPKNSELQVLEMALKTVERGEFWMSRRLASLALGRFVRPPEEPDAESNELTPREWEILALLAGGFRNKEISARLSVAENTTKTHVAAIYRKLRVNTRVGATLHYFHRLQSPAQRKEDRPKVRGAAGSAA